MDIIPSLFVIIRKPTLIDNIYKVDNTQQLNQQKNPAPFTRRRVLNNSSYSNKNTNIQLQKK